MSMTELQSLLLPSEAFLITSQANRRYLTDFDSSDGFLIITRKKCVFLTDSRYIEAAEQKSENCDETVLLKSVSEQLPREIKKLGVSVVYTEEKGLTVSDYAFLKKITDAEVRAEKADAAVTLMRRHKRECEKERITEAQRIAEKAYKHILTFIRPGVTEKDIRLELEYFMLKNGADALSFDTIAISGANTSKPHGVPTVKAIESGDFVTMDYGALVGGYHSDMTRTVAVGSVSDSQAQVYETVLKAQLACLEVYRAGIACERADAAAREVIEQAGYGRFFGHGTGHGVGIDIHEAPSVSPNSKETLESGDVVTAEPGIYLPGKFGVRIEDMVYITNDGCENLTKCEKSLTIL